MLTMTPASMQESFPGSPLAELDEVIGLLDECHARLAHLAGTGRAMRHIRAAIDRLEALD